jgi:hypothetical protein
MADIFGIVKTNPREPFIPASKKQKEAIAQALDELGGDDVLRNN